MSRDAGPWITTVLDERCPGAVQCMDPFHVVGWATEALVTAWIDCAAESDLPESVEVARRVASSIVAIHAALRHRVSKARTAAFNTRLQLINRRAYWFHSAQALIALAMLHLGRLCPPLPGRPDPTHDYVT